MQRTGTATANSMHADQPNSFPETMAESIIAAVTESKFRTQIPSSSRFDAQKRPSFF
jgi:hypothetical protein